MSDNDGRALDIYVSPQVMAELEAQFGRRSHTPERGNDCHDPKGCDGKRKYRSEPLAVRQARRKQDLYGKPCDYYRCTVCGGWHLTTNRNRRAR